MPKNIKFQNHIKFQLLKEIHTREELHTQCQLECWLDSLFYCHYIFYILKRYIDIFYQDLSDLIIMSYIEGILQFAHVCSYIVLAKANRFLYFQVDNSTKYESSFLILIMGLGAYLRYCLFQWLFLRAFLPAGRDCKSNIAHK